MLNECHFIGNLGADPESRYTQAGKQVVSLRLAVTDKWKDQASGERKESTEWISVSIFSEGLCKVAMDYLRKGSKIYISGKWRTRKWQDQSGQDRYSTELVLSGRDGKLVMLDSGEGMTGGGRRTASPQQGGQGGGFGGGFGGPSNDMDDSIPF